MKYRKLGRTGFDVSDIAHGLWGMSGWSGSNDQQSLGSMQLAVDLGCNFFDTAWAYGEGKSDGLLGEIMAAQFRQAALCGVENSSRPMDNGRRCRNINISDVFSAAHVLNTPT